MVRKSGPSVNQALLWSRVGAPRARARSELPCCSPGREAVVEGLACPCCGAGGEVATAVTGLCNSVSF